FQIGNFESVSQNSIKRFVLVHQQVRYSIEVAHLASEEDKIKVIEYDDYGLGKSVYLEWEDFPRASNIEEVQKYYVKPQTFWLGTDKFGRDLWSRILVGTRISIGVGVIAVSISLLLGVTLGAF